MYIDTCIWFFMSKNFISNYIYIYIIINYTLNRIFGKRYSFHGSFGTQHAHEYNKKRCTLKSRTLPKTKQITWLKSYLISRVCIVSSQRASVVYTITNGFGNTLKSAVFVEHAIFSSPERFRPLLKS